MGYLHNRGDYGRMRGDPGILGTLGKLAGGLVSSIVPGGSIVGSAIRALGGRSPTGPSRPMVALPSFPGISGQAVRGGSTKSNAADKRALERSMGGPRRRRMNVTNAKALRRAIRRTDGFVKLAKKALKGTGYTVARRGSTRKGPTTIVETGAGSVHTR